MNSDDGKNSGNDKKEANGSTGGSHLPKLVARAWAAPDMWHSVKGYPLALRVTPYSESSGGSDFEIVNVESIPERGYCPASPNDPPFSSFPPPHKEHKDLSLEIPYNKKIFARQISRHLYEQRAHRIKLSDLLPVDPKWSNWPSAIMNLVKRWYMFVLNPVKLPWWQRGVVSLLGSVTFFYALSSSLLVVKPKWLEEYKRVTNPPAPQGNGGNAGSGQYFAWGLPEPQDIVLFSALLFAFLCAWKIRVIGPVQLYVVSFLVPYAIWTLIMGIDIGEKIIE